MPVFSQGCQHKSRKCKVTWAKSQFPANVTWIPRSELPSSSEVQTKHIMARSDSYSVFLTLGRAHALKRKAPRTCDVLMTGRVQIQIAHLQLAIPVPSFWNFEEYETNLKWTQLLSWLLHMMSYDVFPHICRLVAPRCWCKLSSRSRPGCSKWLPNLSELAPALLLCRLHC